MGGSRGGKAGDARLLWHGPARLVSKLSTFDGDLFVTTKRIRWRPDPVQLRELVALRQQGDRTADRKAYKQGILPLPRVLDIPLATVAAAEIRRYLFELRAVEIFVSKTLATMGAAQVRPDSGRRRRVGTATAGRGGRSAASGAGAAAAGTAAVAAAGAGGGGGASFGPGRSGPASSAGGGYDDGDDDDDDDPYMTDDTEAAETREGAGSAAVAGLHDQRSPRLTPASAMRAPEALPAPWQVQSTSSGFPLLPDPLQGWMDSSSAFFVLGGAEDRRSLLAVLAEHSRAEVVASERALVAPLRALTSQWLARKLSNFEYLMWLNRVAGRTTQDLAQYPVMPWVIADFDSDRLDLENPETFRDLTWPIGAQTPAAQAELRTKHKEQERAFEMQMRMGILDETLRIITGTPHHYGTFYLNPGFVLWFLFRQEPFLRLHVELNDGKFDHADRMFHDIKAAYLSSTKASEVKELPPELYCNPEVLRHNSGVDLGTRHNGVAVDDVTLPPWASGSADTFVRGMRAALESEYVSQRLHHWINLIYGVQQRGPAAQERCNLYHELMYDGSVDLAQLRVKNKPLAQQVEAFARNFGQLPPQLFAAGHPKRASILKMPVCIPLISLHPPAFSTAASRAVASLPPSRRARVLAGVVAWSQHLHGSPSRSRASAGLGAESGALIRHGGPAAAAAAASPRPEQLDEDEDVTEPAGSPTAASRHWVPLLLQPWLPTSSKPDSEPARYAMSLHESPVVVAVSIAGDSPRIVTVDARRHIGVHRWCLRATATPHYESTCDPERLELDTRLAQAGAFVQQLAPLFTPAPWATGRLAPPGPANRGEAVGQALAPAVPRSAGGKRGKSPGQDLRQDSALPLATGGVHGERWLSSELVAFSSDGGHMVLAGQWDSAARVICLLGGCPVTCTVQGHADTVTAVAVAPVPSPCAEVGAVASLNRQVSGRPLAVHLPLSVKGEAGVVVAGPSSQGAVTAGGVMDASAIARSMLSLCEQADRAGGAALVAETASDRAGSLSELAAKVVAASACAAGPADPALLAAASRVLRAAGSSASGGALARSDRGIAARASIGEGVLESTAASVGSVVTKAVSGGAADGSGSGGAFGSGRMSDAVSHSAMAAARAYGLLDSVRSPVSGSRTEGLAGGSAAVLDYLVTASADASVRVWLMHGGLVSRQPMYILHGHDAPVTSVAADSSLDVLLSGSDDGTVIVRQLSSGRYVRTIEPLAAELAAIAEWRRCRHNLRMSRLAEAQRREELARRDEVAAGDSVVVDVSEPMAAGEAEDAATYESMRERAIAQHSRAGPSPVEWVGVSSAGIVVLRIGDKLLRSFSLDGRQLCRSPLMLGTTPHALLFSEDGRYLLVAGGSPYIIIVLDAESLEPVQYIGSDRNRLGVAVTDVQLDPAIASSGGHLSGASAAAAAAAGSVDGSSAAGSHARSRHRGADYRRAIPKLPEDVDPFHVPVTSLAFSRGERHLLVGLASGQLMILKSTQELGQQAVHLAREKLFVN
ncbi:hypothetical protein FNF31_01580 [Cafeteria roenbergensis]|uniref:BEACH domain-containing protein n=1 Tax=Cafeteria roenbergensis TaxID=33653 RepID=A0A5A8DKP4_CAFRO|nr:hypothetical protein FNF31_01580 [Cafeteria roenbergensis]